jgi:hypothetical protein
MRYNIFSLLISVVLLIGCAGSENTMDIKNDVLKKISLEKYGPESQISYNSDRSYSLVVKQGKSTPKDPNPFLRFFVYGMKNGEIIFEENLPAGKVNWKNNYQIEVSLTPEVISAKENNKLYGYIYDVRLGIKTDRNSKSIKQQQ